jgi:hypothetical protein
MRYLTFGNWPRGPGRSCVGSEKAKIDESRFHVTGNFFSCHEFPPLGRSSLPMAPFLQLPPLDSFGASAIYARCPSYWDRIWKPIGVDGQPSKCDICGKVKFRPLCTNYDCPDCHLSQSHVPVPFSRILLSGRMTPEEETLSRFFCVRVTSPGLWHFTGRLESERNTTLVNRTLR